MWKGKGGDDEPIKGNHAVAFPDCDGPGAAGGVCLPGAPGPVAANEGPTDEFATGFIISTDLGKTWTEYDLKQLGNRSPKRFHEKNGEGWFRADLRVGWSRPGEVIFLKPKPA